MRVLVTGATGLVGYPIVERLLARGDQVRALVRDPTRARELLPPEVELVAGDLTRPETLPAAVRDVELVFHAAGLPEQWRRDPADFDRVNHQGTVALLEAALQAGVRRVVYTSTMDVFRTVDGVLREEQLDPDPKPTPYERSKQAADRAVQRFVERGLDVVHVNPATVYGPGVSTAGLNQFFIRLLAGSAPLLPPGGMSVVYNRGLADAHLAAAERGRTGERYLVGDAYVTTVELARAIAEAAGIARIPRVAPAPLLRVVAAASEAVARLTGTAPLIARGELEFLLWQARVDSTKAQQQLGFRPTPLTEGVAATVAWAQAQRPRR